MKILIISGYSDKIARLNELTAPNKRAYADANGYAFENVKEDYAPKNFVPQLKRIQERLKKFDAVMSVGCDTIFTNFNKTIESKIGVRIHEQCNGKGQLIKGYSKAVNQVVIARENLREWPINNDVMIWPRGSASDLVLSLLIKDAAIWKKYPWLWQNHLWNLMQDKRYAWAVKLIDAREMNSTYQPFLTHPNGQTQRIPGPSSWQIGDWILHALDMPLEMRIQVIKWGLTMAGDGTFYPRC